MPTAHRNYKKLKLCTYLLPKLEHVWTNQRAGAWFSNVSSWGGVMQLSCVYYLINISHRQCRLRFEFNVWVNALLNKQDGRENKLFLFLIFGFWRPLSIMFTWTMEHNWLEMLCQTLFPLTRSEYCLVVFRQYKGIKNRSHRRKFENRNVLNY